MEWNFSYTFRCIAKNFPKARTVFQNNLTPDRFYAGIRTIVFGEFQLRLSRVAKTETEISAFCFMKVTFSCPKQGNKMDGVVLNRVRYFLE